MSGRRKLVYFDQTQNERGRLDTTYSELAKLLRDNDFDVEPYTEFMLLAKNLEDASVLVFGCPNSSKLRPAEIDVLKRFVMSGGGLMLLSLSGGDRGLMNNMSQVSKDFGITFENTALRDERNNAGLPTMPMITDIVQHPTTQDVKDLLVPSSCTLSVTAKGFALASSADTGDPPKKPIVACAEAGKGRLLCVGSYEVFRRGGGMKHAGNKQFAINAFKWLSGEITAVEPEVAETEETERPKARAKAKEAAKISAETEKTLRRLVNAVFDLQKDIGKLGKQVTGVEKNLELLRDQFQDFAEKAQEQLGVMIPARQFKTEEENLAAEIEADIKALEKEVKSIRQLKEHVEERHSSGSMPKETYTEQTEKLDARLKSLEKKLDTRTRELEELLS
ncbi:MAG: hypothetical protein AM324_005820 [Candidatus Thorarchaeota archaeon SMTZ1-83]|nr:MAG: hypothetical protein AM324_06965 [Candidatus Thorarchaeota archaeon SMTZ1-83]